MVSVPWYKDMNTAKAHKADELLSVMARLEPLVVPDRKIGIPGTADGWMRLCSNGTIVTYRAEP